MIHYLIFKAISLSDTTHCRIIQTKQIITGYILHKYNGAHCRLSTKIWIDLWHRHFQSKAEMAASKTIHFKIRDSSLRDMHTSELKIYLDFICDGNDLLVIDRINCILFHNLLDPALKVFFLPFFSKIKLSVFEEIAPVTGEYCVILLFCIKKINNNQMFDLRLSKWICSDFNFRSSTI